MSFADALSLFTVQGICINPLLLMFNHYMFIMLVFMDFLVCLEVCIVFIDLGVVVLNAWQGQFTQGDKGHSTFILEAVAS